MKNQLIKKPTHELEQKTPQDGFGKLKGNSINPDTLDILNNNPTIKTAEGAQVKTNEPDYNAFTDINDKGVKVADQVALKMITDGLSTEEAKYVRLNSESFIDKAYIQQGAANITGYGENFKALIELVNADTMLEVSIADEFTTEKGTFPLGQATFDSELDVMYDIEGAGMDREEYSKSHPQYSDVKEWGGILGITFYGDKDTGYGKSADGHTHVVINKSMLTIAEQFKREGLKKMTSIFAHEAYGHYLFKLQGKPHSHGTKKSLTSDMNGEVNLELEKQIYAREQEAEQNFEKNNPK